ncbi:efflux transporter outer membrane subunit, partial [Pelobacter seleniigenes]|uniref:efflux transporter outer membrane subunit n=1 Tax=Pelobacter seleniigenes TaxID=407188 RepID=UPI0004A76620
MIPAGCRLLILTLLSLALSSCAAVGPDYQPPKMTVPETWNNSGGGITQQGREDLGEWWQNLHDPLLTELIEEALRSSPDIRSARAKLREARARRGIAGADYYPTVTGSGSASRSKSSAETGSGKTHELYQVGFDASWELDIFGGVRRNVEAAQNALQASTASFANTRVSLAAEVATNYIQIRSQQLRLKIIRANLASQEETLQLTQWRAQAGLVSSQDVEQARSNLEQTRAQLPSLETTQFQAEHALEILLGKAPGALQQQLSTATNLPLIPDRLAIGIPADTVRQRPDIQVAERNLAAETARLGAAEAARYPTFKLSGSIGLEALTLGGLHNSGADTASLLGGITAPIFNAGKLRKQVEVQDAVREQARISYEQSVLTALSEVENALVSLDRSSAQSEALAAATTAAQNAAELAKQRYSAGLIDFQAVLDAERTVRSSADSLATARADRVLALIRLYKALGGGWQHAAEDQLNQQG